MTVHVNIINKSSASTKSKSTPAKITAASSNKSTESSRSESVTKATTTNRGISEAWIQTSARRLRTWTGFRTGARPTKCTWSATVWARRRSDICSTCSRSGSSTTTTRASTGRAGSLRLAASLRRWTARTCRTSSAMTKQRTACESAGRLSYLSTKWLRRTCCRTADRRTRPMRSWWVNR